MTMTPGASLSSRCTLPGLSGCPPRSMPGKGWMSALTSVPASTPAPGWTTSPAGLLRTIICSSEWMISRGISSGRRALFRLTSRSSTSTTSPSFHLWEGFVQVLFRRTFRSVMSLWIWARLSSERWAERKTSSRRPSPWERVIWNVFSGTLFSFQPEMEKKTGADTEDTEELRGGQTEKGRSAADEESALRMVSPEVFREEAEEGIVHDIKGKDLAVEGSAPEGQEEHQEIEKVESGFEELDWVKRFSEREAGEVMGVLALEDDPERRLALPPVAAAGHEAAAGADT